MNKYANTQRFFVPMLKYLFFGACKCKWILFQENNITNASLTTSLSLITEKEPILITWKLTYYNRKSLQILSSSLFFCLSTS